MRTKFKMPALRDTLFNSMIVVGVMMVGFASLMPTWASNANTGGYDVTPLGQVQEAGTPKDAQTQQTKDKGTLMQRCLKDPRLGKHPGDCCKAGVYAADPTCQKDLEEDKNPEDKNKENKTTETQNTDNNGQPEEQAAQQEQNQLPPLDQLDPAVKSKVTGQYDTLKKDYLNLMDLAQKHDDLYNTMVACEKACPGGPPAIHCEQDNMQQCIDHDTCLKACDVRFPELMQMSAQVKTMMTQLQNKAAVLKKRVDTLTKQQAAKNAKTKTKKKSRPVEGASH